MENIFYIILCILSICRHGHFFENNRFNYMQTKIKDTTNILRPSIPQKDVEIKLDFYNKTTTNLINFENSHIFQISNKKYFLLDSHVYPWASFNGSEMNMTYSLPYVEDEITLIKTSEEFEENHFILTSFKNGVSHIYLLRGNENPIHIQSLKSEEKLRDVAFFINKNSLFLVTVNAKIKIYKYLGKYFDEIETITTKSSKILTFTHQDFEILVFLDTSNKEPSITLYKFNGNLKKLQFIKTPNLFDFEIYQNQPGHNTYMIIFAGKENYIYIWDYLNFEFINLFEFGSTNNAKKAIIVEEECPLIFLITKLGIESFQFSSNNIQRLESFKFEEDVEEIFNVVVENNGIEIFLNNKMSELKVVNVNYFVFVNEIVSSVYNEDPVEDCLLKLEHKLEEELNQFKNRPKRFDAPTDVEIEPDYDPFDLKSIKLNKTTNDVEDLINKVTPKIIGLKSGMINKTLIIDNNLESNSLKSEDINLKIINNIEWTPNNWLSYSKEQIIKTPIETNNLKAKNVEVKSIKNLILKNENLSIDKSFKINNLKCERVLAKSLNGDLLKNIYLKNSNVVINGSKSFNEVVVNNLESPNIDYPDCFKNINQIKFEPNLTVNNLNIKTINGVNWDEINKSKNQELNKSLSIPNITINKLITETINGVNIDDLLTKRTNQTIKSKFILNKSHINNLKVQKVNGVDFNNILIKSNETKNFNRIKILGNLRLKNINISDIFIQGKRFDFNDSNDYWSINTDQTIPGNVTIKNISVNNLKTKTINNVPFNEYISIGKECNFKNLRVKGDLKLNFEKEHSPNWIDLSENIVRNGGGYKLSGQKIFNGTITVVNANIDYLNNVKVDDVATIHKDDFDDYTFDTIIVNELFIKKTTVEKLNNKSINELTNNIQYNDEKLNFKKLSLQNVIIHDLKIEENLNQQNFSKYLDDINEISNIKEINNVEAENNIKVNLAKIAKSINGVNVELIEEAVRKGAIMTGNVTFKNQVLIENLFIEKLNDINLPETFNKLLKRNQHQTISGKYSFNIIRANDLTSNLINNYNLKNLIDTNKKDDQILEGNFKFKSAKIKSLKGELICNLKDVINSFKTPPLKIWSSVLIKGNVTAPDNVLQQIIDNVVRLDQNNIIEHPVKFTSNIHTNNIKSKRGLNGIYLNDIHKDALLKNGDDQRPTSKISAEIIYLKILTCSSAQVDGNADIPIVNAIIIKNINDSLITKDMINKIKIKGHKVFNSGLNVKKLVTTNISGLNTSQLLNLDDLKPIPRAKFSTSDIIGNLSLLRVNNINFNKFLSNRFKKEGANQELSGVYYFDSIETKKSIELFKLNNVEVNDIVEIGENINLTSKNFEGNLTIRGNVNLNSINDADISKKYNLSVFYGKPAKFVTDLVLSNITELNGNIKTNKINGVDIKDINRFLNSNEIYVKTKQNEEIVKEIQDVVQNHKINIKNMPQDFMYLEKLDELQINIPNTISAEVIEKHDGVLINMIGDLPGIYCGLPIEGCNCQNQHILKISNNYSLETISQESSERVFSFHTESISAHLITNTISFNRVCTKNFNRNNSESTTLTWTDLKGLRNYAKFNLTDGFITGVKYFEFMGEVYVVITRFYELSMKTHNLDCVVYKFGRSNGSVELVQKIPTKGAWTLHLFNSPHGLILVIGNIFDSTRIISGTSTDIFIFNENIKQFELLRNYVGSGAISIADLVLNGETQIILVQKDSPLVILKYNLEYNNFYIYQNIYQESEIISVSRFYLGRESSKDAYLNVVTETNQFVVYVYKHVEGWIIESQGEIEGLRSLVPFNLNGNIYLLAPSTKLSSLLTVKRYG